MLRKIALILMIFVWPVYADTVDAYVRSTGSSGNSGLASNAPKATIAQGLALGSSGDTLNIHLWPEDVLAKAYLAAGGDGKIVTIFTDPLLGSGLTSITEADRANVTGDSYGIAMDTAWTTGSLALTDINVTGTTSNAFSGNDRQISLTFTRCGFIQDGTGDLLGVISTSALAAATRTLTITDCSVENGAKGAGTGRVAAYIRDYASATITGMEIIDSTCIAGGLTFVSANTATTIRVDDCDFTGITPTGNITLVSATGKINGLTVDDCTFRPTPNAAFTTRAIYANPSAAAGRLFVRGNLFGSDAVGLPGAGLQATAYFTGGEVSGNILRIGTANVPITLGGESSGGTAEGTNPITCIRVSGNDIDFTTAALSHGMLIGAGANSSWVDANTIRDGNNGLVLKANRCYVTRNKVRSTTDACLYVRRGTDNVIEFNTFVAEAENAAAMLWDDNVGLDGVSLPTYRNRVRHNIFSGVSASYVLNGQALWDCEFDYNIYYSPNASDVAVINSTGYTLTEMRSSLGTDAHSLVANPQLRSPSTGNFMLKATSPAIGAASDGGTIGAWQPNPKLFPKRGRHP